MMCCALHNWLLQVDGYNVPYNEITQSSNPSFSDLTTEDISFTLQRLQNVTINDIDAFSGTGEGSDTTSNNNVNNVNVDEDNGDTADLGKSVAYDITGTNVVRNFSFELFYSKLITHFDIEYQNKEW